MRESTVSVSCGNCGAALTGPYCAHCGQHAHDSARTMAALLHDGWHVLTHVDGRFWRSMHYLLLRPGRLTQEYFAEHRARYLPPVRLYLVLSALFFAFGALAASSSHLAKHPAAGAARNASAAPSTSVAGSSTAASGTSSAHAPDDDDLDLDEARENPVAYGVESGFTGMFDAFKGSDCATLEVRPSWMQDRWRDLCARNQAGHGEPLRQAFLHNIPKMMFLFVPLAALTMLLLYWFPRHYYVEHLVLFLHNHAAVFLILMVEGMLSWIARLLGWRWVHGWLLTLTTFYMVWYMYRAMRVYYGQGFVLTLSKYLVVGFSYTIALSITLLFTYLISMLLG
jgi:hypothetical protein